MKSIGLFIYVASGLISFFWSMSIIIDHFGFLGGLVAFLFFPVTILFAPIYLGFSSGNWTLAAITYSGGLLAAFVSSLANERTAADTSRLETPTPPPSQVSFEDTPNTTLEQPVRNPAYPNYELPDPSAQRATQPVWFVILAAFVAWKSSQTNLEYALTYCAAYFIFGFCLAGIFRLFSKRDSSWSVGDWLNKSSYAMIAILVLSIAIRANVENMQQHQAHQQGRIPKGTHLDGATNPYPSQSSQALPFNSPQGTQWNNENGGHHITKQELFEIQRILTELGYRPGPTDGVLGPRTRDAITLFQRANALPETGESSERLLQFLQSVRPVEKGQNQQQGLTTQSPSGQVNHSSPSSDLQVCNYVDSHGQTVETWTSRNWSCEEMRAAMRANPRNR